MRIRVIKLAATLASIILLSTAPVSAQVPEGGAIRGQSVSEQFPGLTEVISAPEVAREIQKKVGRGSAVLKDITFSQEVLNELEYTFSFAAPNGEWIGSSSFTVVVTTSRRGTRTIEVVQNPDLESVPRN